MESVKNIGRNLRKWLVFIILAVLAVLIVLFRMKGVEQDYKIGEIDKIQHKVASENKSLRAEKARAISVKELKKFAKNHKLKEPHQKQIIVVPRR